MGTERRAYENRCFEPALMALFAASDQGPVNLASVPHSVGTNSKPEARPEGELPQL